MTALRQMFCSIVAAVAPAVAGATGTALTIHDEWWTPGFNARVRIEACPGQPAQVCGTIVWVWDEQPADIVDRQPLIGRQIIRAMRADTGSRWSGGRIYNPEDGRDYEASIALKSANNLLVEGCVLFICRSQVWRRADVRACPAVVRQL